MVQIYIIKIIKYKLIINNKYYIINHYLLYNIYDI